MSFLKTLLEKLLGFFAVFLLGKQHEKTSQAKKKTKAALKEAQRHADTPVTPRDASNSLRKRAKRKRKAKRKR